VTAGITVVRVEQAPVVIVLDAEHVKNAARVGDRLHGDDEPLAHGLAQVLKSELGADLCRAEFETVLGSLIADLPVSRALGKTKFANRSHHKVHFGRLARGLEGRLGENVASPVAHTAISSLKHLAELIGCLGTGAEQDGREDLELGRVDRCGRG